MVGLRNSLQIRTAQTQTLTMTPQLQQAIRLLQLSTLDLRQEIQQTLESNPMLEVDETAANPNVESLDALADREVSQNIDNEVYNPFSDDPSASPTTVASFAHNEESFPPSTAEVLGRDSALYESHEPVYSSEHSEGASFEHETITSNTQDSSYPSQAEIAIHDYNGESSYTEDYSADCGDAANTLAPDVSSNDYLDAAGAIDAKDTSSYDADAGSYDADAGVGDSYDDYERNLSDLDREMAYDLEHLSDIKTSSKDYQDNASLSESSSAPQEDLPEKLASNMDPGEGSTLDSVDNFMGEDNYSAKLRVKNLVTDDDGRYEGETQIDLQDHLLWQLDCSPLKGRDRTIAETIIDGIDESGYLSIELSEILDVVHDTYPEATLDDVKIVLKLIQSYEPIGVGARDVQECLLLQLRERLKTDQSEDCKMAEEILLHHLDLLSNHDYRSLCSCLGIKIDALKQINDIIVSLSPRPGRTVVKEKANYIVPDVIVIKDKDGNYDVELNPDALPRVKLNEQYKSLVCYARNEREKEFFKSNLQEANWFIQSIAKRNDTLLKVSRCIVEHQKAFLDYGEHRMEPLVLNDIAQEIEMHESTISRVTTEKYIYTSRGTFELKYFFSSHVSTDNGGTASSTAIRAEIKTLVANENPRRPYSDNQIANLLKEKGYCVARRTIAKYREALGIGSSSQRKRLV